MHRDYYYNFVLNILTIYIKMCVILLYYKEKEKV